MAAGVRWSYVSNSSRLDAVLKRFVAQRERLVADAEADLRWGKPASFSALLAEAEKTLTIIWPPEEPDEEEEEPPLQYNEEWRSVETIRVENPEDSEQYVDVERITSIIFRGPDGRRHQFNLDHGD